MPLVMCFLAAADGVKLYEQRQFAEAESELRRTLAAQPDDAQSRLYLARTLVELGRVSEALSEIDRALAGKSDAEIQFQAGGIIRELAQRRFADLQRLSPDSPAVHELAARNFERQGKLTEALREYRAAIAKEPERPGLHYEAGNILWRMRELEAAAAEFRTELARTPNHGMANLRLGQIFLTLDQPANAVTFLERAVAAQSDSTDARRELGKAYRTLGRSGDARTQWEFVAKTRPDDDQVHYLLGTLYRQMGDIEAAERELSRHHEILERRRKRE